MLLSCTHCQSRFKADDSLRGKTFRCRVCAAPIKAIPQDELDGPTEASIKPPKHTPSQAPVVSRSRAPERAAEPAPVQSSRAAVVQRNDERSKRDLFAAKESVAPPPVVEREVASPFTAARNETSVLFSLDQLAKPKVPDLQLAPLPKMGATSGASGDSARPKADSGVIDLFALMAADHKPLDAKSIRPAPLSEPPLGAFTREVSLTPAPIEVPAFRGKGNPRIWIAAAAAGLLLMVGIGAVASRSEDARVEAAAAAAAKPPPPPVVAAAPEPAPPPPVVTAAAPETTTEAKAKPASGKASYGKKSGGAKAGKASAASTAPATPKKAAASPCGCKAGDLMCSIKCSAK